MVFMEPQRELYPSGIALVRIVDPEFKTSTAVELGLMNLVMLLSTPVYFSTVGYGFRRSFNNDSHADSCRSVHRIFNCDEINWYMG